jgi:hypothetical protein
MTGLDHLVVGVADLPEGARQVEAMLRVPLSPGGSHERWGTRNLLTGLGEGAYLEVLGPDPAGGDGVPPFPLAMAETPRLVAWCVAVDDLEAAVGAAAGAGYELSEPFELSRRTADGELLRWRLAMPSAGGADLPVLPFLIHWGGAPHPTTRLPARLRLLSLGIQHPQPARISRVLDALGITLPVGSSPTASLVARIATPAGAVDLRSGS